MPDLEAHLVHGEVFENRTAGAINEHVEAPESRYRSVDCMFDRVVSRDVRLDENRFSAGFADLSFSAPSGFRIDINDGDLRALLRELERAYLGDPGSAARQEGDLSTQP
jgi:hypothetical protein